MTLDEVCLVDAVLSHSKNVLFATPTIHVPCHNDYHSQNVMLDEKGQLWAIDFENCDLGDPMWGPCVLDSKPRVKAAGPCRSVWMHGGGRADCLCSISSLLHTVPLGLPFMDRNGQLITET
ncbi:hypothetical protein N656DRAFT_23956 [Canariomyces notabilis]|uniref:Aminoglycoside phosphotransferase domain-containing protein n=1 Tax=Canariomyces notabilis TaxID=2074819 RepID=A0AAN6TNJ0_9PEZI|nr:hypothetical protein N656DRAFT_23956 [Canariomyces arenarius]